MDKTTKDHREAFPIRMSTILPVKAMQCQRKTADFDFITWNKRPIRHALFTHVFGTPAAQR